MSDVPSTVQSTALRTRDKAIQRKHDEEIQKYKIALDKQKFHNTQLRESLWDLKNRTKKLVEDLGFPDVMEAQVYIDGMRAENDFGGLTYRNCLELVGKLKNDLEEAARLNEKMGAREKELEEENSTLRREKEDSASSCRRLSAENKNLVSRLEDTVQCNELAAQRRQKDYDKWQSFKRWIFCAAEIAEFQQYDKQFGFNGKERAKELFKIVAGKKYKLKQLDNLEDSTLFELASTTASVPAVATSPLGDSSKVNQQAPGKFSLTSSEANNGPAPDPPLVDPIPSDSVNRTLIIAAQNPQHCETHVPSTKSKNTNTLGSSQGDDADAQFSVQKSKVRTSNSNSRSLSFALPKIPSSSASPDSKLGKAPAAQVPDSETEDESQSLRWSQFPAPTSITRTVISKSTGPTLSPIISQGKGVSSLVSPPPPSQPRSQQHQRRPLPSLAPSRLSSCSPTLPRVLVLNSSPLKNTDAESESTTPAAPSDNVSSRPPNRSAIAAPPSPAVIPKSARPSTSSSANATNPKSSNYNPSASAAPINPTSFSKYPDTLSRAARAPLPRPRSRSVSPDIEFVDNDKHKPQNGRGDEYDESPRPRKYFRSDENQRIPSSGRDRSGDRGPDTTSAAVPMFVKDKGTRTGEEKKDRRKTDGGAALLAELVAAADDLENKENRSRDRRRSDGDMESRKSDEDRDRAADRSQDKNQAVYSESGKGKGKGKERVWETETPTNGDRWMERKRQAATTSKKQGRKGPLDDYMPFKGHGRYGRKKDGDEEGDTRAPKTINELYEIDPSRNGGFAYEYNEVVRGNARKQLAVAEDCEECREYYRAVGPLPPRLQPPLWKSPVKGSSDDDGSPIRCQHKHANHRNRNHTSSRKRGHPEVDEEELFDDFDSPSKGKRNQNRRGEDRGANWSKETSERSMQAHKQTISRHRAAWSRAVTPPGYWEIGFPDTQMVGDINERANEIHQQKMQEIEREAAEGRGRWRKR
ncbi:hypothetical protein GYMLUDRAFT_753315 [Collybiopsis luxurians FD-317 M1]|uniref:DNA endonuclease activator Ctp1 C-terminal domain-containing protein n=1 Tax=Collybiopsis luxurians FD-317 M1 TaxID=944289 RepID=A0A0D0CQA8_9AGAR|nr:hypothetical protein GYMLUDRAFT_753315 [Collybiopsis luxurians FD-317 M1]